MMRLARLLSLRLVAGLCAGSLLAVQPAFAQSPAERAPAQQSQPGLIWPFSALFGNPSPNRDVARPGNAPARPAQPRPGQPPAQPSRAAVPAKPAPAKPVPVVPEGPPPAYERDLMRLAEVLGALSVLRDICGGDDANEVRASMQALLDAEAQTEARRERLAGAYNKYARAYALTHRACTDSSKLAMQRFLADGAVLARAISGRFGG